MKVVAITYERWSFTRDSNNYYMALTSEIKLRVTSRYLPEVYTFRSAKLKMFAVIYKGDRLHDTLIIMISLKRKFISTV